LFKLEGLGWEKKIELKEGIRVLDELLIEKIEKV
jgi:hypothetical protein